MRLNFFWRKRYFWTSVERQIFDVHLKRDSGCKFDAQIAISGNDAQQYKKKGRAGCMEKQKSEFF